MSESSRTYHNKLVRDKVPQKITAHGDDFAVRPVKNQDEFVQELRKKIVEEAYEVARARSRAEFMEEYADLVCVLDTLMECHDISESELKEVKQKNLDKKGGFAERFFLEWSDTVVSNNHWK